MSQDSIIVAVDFGATWSGVGWALASAKDPREQVRIMNIWPGMGSTVEKVPTYDNSGNFQWGFAAAEGDGPLYENFKAGLDEPLHLPRIDKKAPEDLVTDYLRGLKDHAEEYLKLRLGDAMLRILKREYVIPVPAIWSERTIHTMNSCAKRAGMSQIRIITDMEAAAMWALISYNSPDISVGDTIVICDAGGETVDLVSYAVGSLHPTPQLYECATGSGGRCGGNAINRNFSQWLNNKFQNYSGWDEEYHEDAMRRFEQEVKPQFDGNDRKQFFFPVRGLPDNPLLSIRRGKLEILGHEIRALFDPIVSQIINLVTDQTARTSLAKTVLLVGGFARNQYLKTRIQQAVGSQIHVVLVKNSNTAVIRGAVLRCLAEKAASTHAAVRIGSRISRKHYGTLSYVQFDPEQHDLIHRERDVFAGYDRVKVYNWFIKKGETIQETTPRAFNLSIEKPVSDGALDSLSTTVYVCDDPKNTGPPLHEDPAVTELTTIKPDLSAIPLEELKRELGPDDMWYYKVDFEVRVTLQSASIKFSLVYRGKQYTNIVAEFL